MRPAAMAGVFLVILGMSSIFAPTRGAAASTTRVVPDQYGTIQAAVNAAAPGDTVKIRAGTFSEQVSIGKSLRIVGAGTLATTIHAPSVLVPGALAGRASIIEISNGAAVEITALTVSGPGATACGAGSLDAGIRVIGGATLDIHDARVSHVHDAPKHDCNFNGVAIAIGALFVGEVGHAKIQRVVIDDYQTSGITVFEPGSDAVVTDSIINAQIAAGEVVSPGGVEVGDGAVARVTRNVIRGNRCTSPELRCGPDPISQIQSSGIGALGGGPFLPPGPGTEFAYNVIAGNDVGIYLAFVPDCCLVHDNVLLNNLLFGIAIQDGNNTVSNDLIVGGQVGVGAIADAVDTTATLKRERIFGASVARTQELQCCGVKATIIEQ